ncbi:MAG: hypothetical protein Q7J73_02520 [Dehalococcoidales bacterium]|nr:hypothetical protein [Dehalococcoidales bacterium]
MEFKTLALDLGSVGVLQNSFVALAAGWYIDPLTGVKVFYDPNTQNFYTLSGGVYIPLGYMNTTPKQVPIGPGEKLKITLSYKYSGPAVSGYLERYCVGVYGAFGFNEALVGENTRSLPASTTPISYTSSYTFTIPAGVGTDWDDIYCKIYGGSPSMPQTLFGYENALIIAGQQPSITEFAILDFAKV